ncbi:MAG: hypothetical protein ISR48_06390, partial [Alphaproteobacteria bacterium]|nr:hypothetical protein [Alphaproteobacteria bacterium]
FYEGNWESRNRHAHILLHTPSFLWGQNIDADFSMEWMMLDSKDPHSRGSRTLKLPYIKKIENRYIGNAAAIYSSKQVGKLPSWEDWFFAT